MHGWPFLYEPTRKSYGLHAPNLQSCIIIGQKNILKLIIIVDFFTSAGFFFNHKTGKKIKR